MNFSFEAQGPMTYLICKLDFDDIIDTLSLGMLTNNHIPGIAPMLYTELNGQRFLKYNVSAKIPVSRFFTAEMTKERFFIALKNIIETLCDSDDYMIAQSCFELDTNHIFINDSNCDVALVCVPICKNKNFKSDLIKLFKCIIEVSAMKQCEGSFYIDEIYKYINDENNFSIYDFRDFVFKLESKIAPTQANMPFNQSADASQPKNFDMDFKSKSDNKTNLQSHINPTSIAEFSGKNFDSTVSINIMPVIQDINMKTNTINNAGSADLKNSLSYIKPVINGNINSQNIYSQLTRTPEALMNPKQKLSTSADQNGAPVPSAGRNGVPVPPAVRNAINSVPYSGPQAANVKKTSDKTTDTGNDKKISLFKLLTHYNKENAELYKAQKSQKQIADSKGKKSVKKKINKKENISIGIEPDYSKIKSNPYLDAYGSNVPVNPMNRISNGGYKPNPINNQFSETVVLNNLIGETTVLSTTSPAEGEAYITRLKNNERFVINKPVFRIGKERSYVDYFISDNTAISRSHANIIKENNNYYIEDTNSTNHTYVNGSMVRGNNRIKLSDGDRIRLANEDFIFSF